MSEQQTTSLEPAEEKLGLLPPEYHEIPDPPDISHIEIEDGQPVDNLFSEKQQRLLTEPLYSSWAGPGEGRPFWAAANVGLFYAANRPGLAPDVFLSLDVSAPDDILTEKINRAYFFWQVGKGPDIVIEIVSNKKGREMAKKFSEYARMGIPYYAILDPLRQVQQSLLTVYEIRINKYEPKADWYFPHLGLSLTLWDGEYEGTNTTWLRWCDLSGHLIPCGKDQAERADQAEQRANQAEQHADQAEQRATQAEQQIAKERLLAKRERKRAERERKRADQLAAKLRALGLGDEDELA